VAPYPFRTLPDYLRPRLRLIFVGINPGVFSVEHRHYFARPTSRFWRAFSRSVLSEDIRQALGLAALGPEDDRRLLRFGIGFTDVVKVPSRNAAALSPGDFQTWAPRLLRRLARYRPRVACFHGVTAYRAFARHALGREHADSPLGAQPLTVGATRLFVVPNPSPANAHFGIEDQVRWYDRLAEFLREPGAASTRRRTARARRASPEETRAPLPDRERKRYTRGRRDRATRSGRPEGGGPRSAGRRVRRKGASTFDATRSAIPVRRPAARRRDRGRMAGEGPQG